MLRFIMSEFISLYSGSSGNSSVVRCGKRYLIVDMGKGVRTTGAALKELELNISDCDGILVTHEHSDHVKGLSTFLKKYPLPVYGAEETLEFLDANDIGVFGVKAFPTSHDVPCVGYRIHTPDEKTMTIATDLGVLTPAVHEALSGCDLVALESNYDLHMLRSGPYPYYLRARIESVRGHLSNDECAASLPSATSRRRTTPLCWRCRPSFPPSVRRASCRTRIVSSRPSGGMK